MTVFQVLAPGAVGVPVEAEVAEDVCVRLGDNVELHVGERTTSVIIDGEQRFASGPG